MKHTKSNLEIVIEMIINLHLIVERWVYKTFHKEGKLLKDYNKRVARRAELWVNHCSYLQSDLDKEHMRKYGWTSKTI